jgi:hypothetical protein
MTYSTEIAQGDTLIRSHNAPGTASVPKASRGCARRTFPHRSRHCPLHRQDHARGHGRLRCRPVALHPVAGLLARLHRPAEDDRDQEALRLHSAPLPLPVRLDGRRPALGVRSAPRPVHARENQRSSLIEELYTFLRQADARELGLLFRDLDAARKAGNTVKQRELLNAIDNYETHVVPIIADIDAGFGNAEATYLLAKKMIEAGACCLQIENQVSDEKQCGHQDGKVTVPHEDFLAKIRAIRYAFLELGVDDG